MDALADFLRARRGQTTPQAVGLTPIGVRRVPGLRREEVARLAGLSVDYYTRLEQGRERHPSSAVLRALARTLRLEADAERYLYTLASELPPPARPIAVGEHLRELLEDFDRHPAVVINARNDVLASNALGRALFEVPGYDGNLARLIFLHAPAGYYRDRAAVAAACVAGMRSAMIEEAQWGDLHALADELNAHSDEFRTLWARAEVRAKTSGAFQIHHPLVGDLDLVYETMRPNSAPGTMLKVYRALPGSASAERLALLGALHAESIATR